MEIPDAFLTLVPQISHSAVVLWLSVFRTGQRRVNPSGEAMRVLTFCQRQNPARLPRQSLIRAANQLGNLGYLLIYHSRLLTRPDLYAVPEFPPFRGGTKSRPQEASPVEDSTPRGPEAAPSVVPKVDHDQIEADPGVVPKVGHAQIEGGTKSRPLHNYVVVVDDTNTKFDLTDQQQQIPGLLRGAELDQWERNRMWGDLHYLGVAGTDSLLDTYGERRVYTVARHVRKCLDKRLPVSNPPGLLTHILKTGMDLQEL